MRTGHQKYLKLASASVDGRITRIGAALLAKHCRTCGSCRAALDELEKLRGLLAETGPATVPPYFMTRLHARLREEQAAVVAVRQASEVPA